MHLSGTYFLAACCFCYLKVRIFHCVRPSNGVERFVHHCSCRASPSRGHRLRLVPSGQVRVEALHCVERMFAVGAACRIDVLQGSQMPLAWELTPPHTVDDVDRKMELRGKQSAKHVGRVANYCNFPHRRGEQRHEQQKGKETRLLHCRMG